MSLALQARCGFRVVGRHERIGKLAGIWRDTVLTERRSDRVENNYKHGRVETPMQIMCILCVYTSIERWCMASARVFRSGNSQAVRLPKQFRLKSKEVEIFRRGDEIVLREKDGTMVRAFDLLAGLPNDLELTGREKDLPQKRKGL